MSGLEGLGEWLAWWLAPLSGAATHAIAPWAAWHARAMVLGWGVLVPLAALLARYFKVMPGQDWPRELDNPAWWHAHRWLAGVALVAMAAGAVLATGRPGGGGTSGLAAGTSATGPAGAAAVHAWLGWALLAAAAAQLALGLCRGSKGGPTDTQLHGDHYDMTPRRVRFERLHKSIGWLACLGAVPCTVLGLVIADAPRWMLGVLGLWWLALAGAFVALQRVGRCLDTYQAIWGPDPALPGNQRRPVGWGVRRA
ncbi:MAG: hypothetical protein RI988_1535 [Pseudomonadota bacterium]|jgi:hypothetical protein